MKRILAILLLVACTAFGQNPQLYSIKVPQAYNYNGSYNLMWIDRYVNPTSGSQGIFGINADTTPVFWSLGSGLTVTNGVLSASGGGGGTPGGNNGDYQYNNGGSFGGYSLAQITANIFGQTITTVNATTVNVTNFTFGAVTFTGVTGTGKIVADTAPQISAIELGAASDTTLSRSAAGVLAVEGVVIPSISSTNTLTNKRVTARVTTITSNATPTVNTDNCDVVSITAQAADITSMSTNLTGSPQPFDQLEYAITGTAARAITWNSSGSNFTAGPVALPTTTVTTKTLHVYFERNAANTTWLCMASSSDT